MSDILNPIFQTIVMEAKKTKKGTKEIKVSPEDVSGDSDKKDDVKVDKGQDYSIEDDEVSSDDETDSDKKGANDYGDNSENDDDDEGDAGQGNEYSGENDDLEEDEGSDDPDDNAGPTDYGTGDDPEGDGLDGEDGEESDNPETPEENIDNSKDVRDVFLYKDFVKLQDFIIDNISKLRKTSRTSYFIKEVDNQCIKNFTNLRELVTNYIIFKFKNNNYTVNLYNYNNFVTLVKINTQILKKVANSKSNS